MVLKIDSPDVIYKSDVGGVELNITNSASVREVFANILERTRQALPNALVHGVSVQSDGAPPPCPRADDRRGAR